MKNALNAKQDLVRLILCLRLENTRPEFAKREECLQERVRITRGALIDQTHEPVLSLEFLLAARKLLALMTFGRKLHQLKVVGSHFTRHYSQLQRQALIKIELGPLLPRFK